MASLRIRICLYTCCVTRAVNIDIVPDMSTETVICSLKRFCARRGVPHLFISDNGKTFKAASKIITAIIAGEEVQEYLSHINVKWCFNLAKAPWWGGIFDRLIRSTKRCLRKVIGRAKLTYDKLLTVVVEIESIINSRPLSYVTPDDLEKPLTPLHLLMGRCVLSLPDNLGYQEEIGDTDFELNPVELSKRVKYLNNTLNHFWRQWRQEYLVELREAHRFNSGSPESSIAVNDLVMLHGEGRPRGFWKLAKVENLMIGSDGRIRGATVRVSSKDGTTTTLQRPLSLLYPLEINTPNESSTKDASAANLQEDEQLTTDQLPDMSQEVLPTRQSTRAAASKAINRVREWIAALDGDEDQFVGQYVNGGSV